MSEDQAPVSWMGWPADTLLWERFGDDFLVYNRRSGATHVLNATAADVLKIVQCGPATLPMVVAEIRHVCDLEDEAMLAQHISRVIQEFDRAGLIYPCHG